MTPPDPAGAMGRREAMTVLGAAGAGLLLGASAADGAPEPRESAMKVTCLIRYEIDPFQRDAFAEYAKRWGPVIPRCGGTLVGYFLPSEGTNDIAWAVIGFDSLAAYEAYRGRLRADPDGRANFEMAQKGKFIRREERTFVQGVEGTLNLPARPAR